MSELSVQEAFEELSSAEEFLEFLGVEYDAKVVHVNRLHIMQRFHDYLDEKSEQVDAALGDDNTLKAIYAVLLARAYQDFVESDALTEKVFRVFHMHEPQTDFVSIDQLMG